MISCGKAAMRKLHSLSTHCQIWGFIHEGVCGGCRWLDDMQWRQRSVYHSFLYRDRLLPISLIYMFLLCNVSYVEKIRWISHTSVYARLKTMSVRGETYELFCETSPFYLMLMKRCLCKWRGEKGLKHWGMIKQWNDTAWCRLATTLRFGRRAKISSRLPLQDII